MKVVALLSGGKDSCYSVMKCVEHGHSVVALAHIAPEDSKTQEADSFMYQTVGSEAVKAVADAFQIPLFLGQTRAKALDTDLAYVPTAGDEVEDLHSLLARVKAAIPDIAGVCSGAIFSDYQRLRVESVCSRLGLVSLAYLWRRNQRELLDEMIEAGVVAVVIKVAAMGLNTRHLGRTLAELRDELHQLDNEYGLHVCGEGGEFETFVLDCPLFHKKIRIARSQKIVLSEDVYAPVAILRIDQWSLQEKETGSYASAACSTPLNEVPPQSGIKNAAATESYPLGIDTFESQAALMESEACVSVTSSNTSQTISVYSAINSMMERAMAQIKSMEFETKDIYYCTLSLRDMSVFPEANRAYCQYFSDSPPSRACLELAFSSKSEANITLKLRKGKRTNLHVQSLSEWAPPCIGPYSQLTSIAGKIYVSGVIALQARTGALVSDVDFDSEFATCRQNLLKTLEVPGVGLDSLISIVVFVTNTHDLERARSLTQDLASNAPQSTHSIMLVSGLPRGAQVELLPVLQTSDLTLCPGEHGPLVENTTLTERSTADDVSLLLSNRRLLHATVNVGPGHVRVLQRLDRTKVRAVLSLLYHEECVDLVVNGTYLEK